MCYASEIQSASFVLERALEQVWKVLPKTLDERHSADYITHNLKIIFLTTCEWQIVTKTHLFSEGSFWLSSSQKSFRLAFDLSLFPCPARLIGLHTCPVYNPADGLGPRCCDMEPKERPPALQSRHRLATRSLVRHWERWSPVIDSTLCPARG